jgi:hypothetical protein
LNIAGIVHTGSFAAQALNVFIIKAAMVIGPTPPGTGVIKLHLDATS